jgi:hypothetical protein
MALTANVNGKPVYSDKQMAAVVNTRVTFTDGSWCDVRTGEVHNNGSGYINIGGSDSGGNAPKITEGPKQVEAIGLELQGLAADVQVDIHQGSGIEYTITGPANQVNAIRANVQGCTLVIEGDGSGGSSGGVTLGRNYGVVVGNGTVMSNFFGGGGMTSVVTGGGGESENLVKVTVKVPQGASVSANHVSGAVVIGNTNGPLSAAVSAGSSLRAGRVASAQLAASSSGSIYVKQANGPVRGTASSSGDITVDDGNMPSLMATASSSGDISVGGNATSAMLKASSSARIHVDHVMQQPMVTESSSGSVRVRRVG